jgi:hypothetical protein
MKQTRRFIDTMWSKIRIKFEPPTYFNFVLLLEPIFRPHFPYSKQSFFEMFRIQTSEHISYLDSFETYVQHGDSLYLTALTKSGEMYKVLISSWRNFLNFPLHISLGKSIFLRNLFSASVNSCPTLRIRDLVSHHTDIKYRTKSRPINRSMC